MYTKGWLLTAQLKIELFFAGPLAENFQAGSSKRVRKAGIILYEIQGKRNIADAVKSKRSLARAIRPATRKIVVFWPDYEDSGMYCA